jgi:hydroxymethylpyrimidine/phosphomethylpyrimidine kinase
MGARGFAPATPKFLAAQLDALGVGAAGGERLRCVKVGMLATTALAQVLAERLAAPALRRVPLVFDPVLAATSGARLLRGAPLDLLPLLARARLVTPNLDELAALTGDDVSSDEHAIRAARRLPARAVLIKGGHRHGAPLDLLVEGRTVVRFAGRRREGTKRGTGCRLASAIAGLLAQGETLESAIQKAKRLVERYLDSPV